MIIELNKDNIVNIAKYDKWLDKEFKKFTNENKKTLCILLKNLK